MSVPEKHVDQRIENAYQAHCQDVNMMQKAIPNFTMEKGQDFLYMTTLGFGWKVPAAGDPNE